MKLLLAGQQILLGVTGGIAAYKSADLVRRLKKAGADVEFVELDGVPHHDARLYVDALKGSVPWLQKQWKKEDNASSSSK